MKLIKYLFIAAIFVGMGSGCNDFFDVNTDPSAASEEEITPQILLPTAITGTASAQFSTAYTAALVTHQLDNAQSGYYTKFSMPGGWSAAYLTALNNLETIIAKAKEEESPYYSGIAKVLKAVNLGLLTDCWENVPYSEALQGETNITPAFDKQEDLYPVIQSLLDAAISDLDAESSFSKPGADDLIYGGNNDKWKKLAHSLKARYMLHLSNKSGVDWNAILDEVDQGFTSNDDDFQMPYPENEHRTNPWYSSVSRKITESIYTKVPAKYLVDLMNGNIYPGLWDPRLFKMVEIETEDSIPVGMASYEDDPFYNCITSVNTWYMQQTSPLLMMTNAELRFIEAEAALHVDPARAYTAYMAGITAHMTKLEVDAGEMAAYMDAPDVKLDGANTDLEHIMKEKIIALFLNTEAWTDMRRNHFDVNVFKGFEEPDYGGRDKPILRASYPSSEDARNPKNVAANRKDILDPMWRDQ